MTPVVPSPLPPSPAVHAEPGGGRAPVDADALIMIVDDEPLNIRVASRLLRLEGYRRFITSENPADAVRMIKQNSPDLLLLDLMMAEVSGFDILREVRSCEGVDFTPIVILSASTDRESRLRALELGATDFINKPIDPSELAPRVRNILAMKRYQDRLKNYSHDLEQAVRLRTAELEASRQDVIHCLARAAEYRDDDTGKHVIRVGRYARLIGEAMGFSAAEADVLEQAAQLHDVGKIGIPDSILHKPGKLTEDEFDFMRKHCGFGKHILQRMSEEEEVSSRKHVQIGALILEAGSSPVLDLASRIALTHHEWWDGSGYPLGLSGEEIPIEGRITAIADVFDALSTRRCYKAAMPLDRCFEIIRDESGTHFDPAVHDAFVKQRAEILEVQIRHAEET